MFLDGTHTSCCDQHDIDYAMGANRAEADLKLKRCIRKVREEQYKKDVAYGRSKIGLFIKYKTWRVLAVLVYWGVRVFGWYFWNKAQKNS